MNQNRKSGNLVEPRAQEVNLIVGDSFWKNRKNILFLGAILLITFLVYLPSLQNGFVNWDDNVNIYENPLIVSIKDWGDFLDNVAGIFITPVGVNYNPLPILTFATEKVLYGFDNLGLWHLDNILLHLGCVALVFRISLSLGLQIIPASFCALLFGIHPMRVESVAWLTERKDVLYGAFYFLALYYYIKSVKLSFRKRYLLIIVTSFTLALLSKIQAVTLPLSMLLVDYYFERKLTFRLISEKWFYFLLAAATGIGGIYFIRREEYLINEAFYPLFERFFLGSYAYIIYFVKSLVPYKMVPVYPYPEPLNWTIYISILPFIVIIGAIILLFLKNRKWVVVGLLFFSFNVLFILQIFPAGQAFLADRFTYVAYYGLFFMYSFIFQCILKKYKNAVNGVCCLVVLFLGILGCSTYQQNKIWRNSETLWTYVLQYYPLSPEAWGNRGYHYRDKGQLNDAIRDYTEAIRLFPESNKYLIERANTFIKLYKYDNALQDLDAAEKINPDKPLIYMNRAIVYKNLGLPDRVQVNLEKYLSYNPNAALIWSNLGIARRLNKQFESSIRAFNRAIQLSPNMLSNYYNRSITYFEMGEIEAARNDLNFLKSKGFEEINPEYERKLSRQR
jgi:tetratricopeptide (TPR) repeat protein